MATVQLSRNGDLPNKLNKTWGTTIATLSGQLVNESDDYSLELRVSCDYSVIEATLGANYLRMYASNSENYKYYFIDSIEMVREGLYVIKGRMDVLMTYKTSILQMYVLAERSTSAGSPMIDDPYVVEALSKTRLVSLFPNQLDLTENAGAYVMLTSQIGYDA